MRKAVIERTTKETQISITLSLDEQFADIDTGIGFFDHMLTAFAVHGGFGLSVRAKGDLYVDCHHTIEDTGIVLGKALDNALGDKGGIYACVCFQLRHNASSQGAVRRKLASHYRSSV